MNDRKCLIIRKEPPMSKRQLHQKRCILFPLAVVLIVSALGLTFELQNGIN